MDKIEINAENFDLIKNFFSLKDGSDQGIFIADGRNIFSKAKAANLNLNSILSTSSFYKENYDQLKNLNATYFEIKREQMRKIAGYSPVSYTHLTLPTKA